MPIPDAPEWLAATVDFLLPDPCLACNRSRRLLGGACGLCRQCFGRLRPPPDPACRGCGQRLLGAGASPSTLCGSCRRAPPAHERLFALWEYRPPLDRVMRALKFHRLDYLGAEIATVAAVQQRAQLAGWELVVPVPLHWRRRWLRGFNQAERIASPLARALGVSFDQPLSRAVATRPQTSLPRAERLHGPRCAFRVRHPELLTDLRVLLVDDVATTGATLRAAAAALRAAGAGAVGAFVVALTPPPGVPGPGADTDCPNAGRSGNALHPLAR